MLDLGQAAAHQVDNPAVRPYSAGNAGAAERGQTADIVFDVHGNKIAEGHRPGQHFIIPSEKLSQLDDRQRAGDPLIATACRGHHGHCAAVHPGVRGRSRSGNHRIRHIASEQIHRRLLGQLFAYLQSVVTSQAFIGDGLVHPGAFEQKFQICERCIADELIDAFQ
ncbi:hypothetical protein D3C73_1182540 [compost metagenome]